MNLENTNVLVLDEADRMCDMGFEDDIKKVKRLLSLLHDVMMILGTRL
jgi:superfamily II DNA/RNA helicase